jgi:hypothetical protein
MAACNLLQKGDKALVVNTGYFGDRFGEWCAFFPCVMASLTVASHSHTHPSPACFPFVSLTAYGADVSHARTDIGNCPSVADVTQLLGQRLSFAPLLDLP